MKQNSFSGFYFQWPENEFANMSVDFYGASLVAQMVKNMPALRETWVPSLGWEDPLEKGMATRSSILTWRIPWTKEPGGLQFMGSHRVEHDWMTNTFIIIMELFWFVLLQITNSKENTMFSFIILTMTVHHCVKL